MSDKYPKLLELLDDRSLLEQELIRIKDSQLKQTQQNLNAEIQALEIDLGIKKKIYQAEIDMLSQIAQARLALAGQTGTMDARRALMSEQQMSGIGAGKAYSDISSLENRINMAKGVLSKIGTDFG